MPRPFTDSHQMLFFFLHEEPYNSIYKLTILLEIYWACELHTTDVCVCFLAFCRLLLLEGNKCFVLVKCISEILVLELTLLWFDTRYYCMVRRPPPSLFFALSFFLGWDFFYFWGEWCCALVLKPCVSPRAQRGEQNRLSQGKSHCLG